MATGLPRLWKLSLCVFDSLDSACLQASLISFNALISSFDKSRWEDAAGCLTSLEKQMRADAISYNAMISSCGSANWQLAVRSLARSREAHIQPTCVTCNAAIAACRRWDLQLHALCCCFSCRGSSSICTIYQFMFGF